MKTGNRTRAPGPRAQPATPIDRARLRTELAAAGLRPGMAVLVHCSMRAVGRVEGGAEALCETLLELLDEEHGTLVVPTQTTSASLTSPEFQRAIAQLADEDRELYLKVLPGFDALSSPSEGMGVLAESVRTHPQAHRSPHPTVSFAAVGRHAAAVCAAHPLDCLLGGRSPLGALRDLDARVLLLGVGFDRCTAFHLGEDAAFDRERSYCCKIGDEWQHFTGFPHRDEDFAELGSKFEQRHGDVVHRGNVGNAPTRLFPLALAATFATEELPFMRFAH
jgi:aminoglycoside 3-N-acetyltransferase